MSFFDKFKPLIVTILFMALLVLSLFNIVLHQKAKEQNELLFELTAALPEEEIIELPESLQSKAPEKNSNTRKTHHAFNESSKADAEDFESRLKTLNEKLSSGLKASGEASEGEDGNITDGDPQLEEEKKEPGKGEEEKPENILESNNRNSSISYSLLNRKALRLPNPIYTCRKKGKIVVNITVNQNGYVIEKSINKASSTSRDGCLYDNALSYAQSTRFNTGNKKTQIGTLTYLFNY